MPAVTVRHSAKPFTWSYSRLKNFEVCPRRHQQIDLLKNFKDDSEQLQWGEIVHKAAAKRLGPDKVPLPKELFTLLEPWCAKVEEHEGRIYVEQKYALTEDLKPTGYFDRNVYFRTVADVVQVRDIVALAVDWKTGQIKEDSMQLALVAQAVFSHYPNVRAVRSDFIWLKEDTTTTETFRRRDMPKLWNHLGDRIAALKNAYDTGDYPPIHNKLCRKWCPVTTCEFHGVSTWE